MAFESFYGGRQGASFVIVKQFAAIDQNKTPSYYKTAYLAIDPNNKDYSQEGHTEDGLYIYYGIIKDDKFEYIKRTGENYNKFTWNYEVLDKRASCATKLIKTDNNGNIEYDPETGAPIVLDDTIIYRPMEETPLEEDDFMVQCFAKGGETTNIVNYGEYVIIDTPHKSDPDNGKVFRRGLAYDEDPLAGAEYIGQIVGPEGPATEIAIGHESYIKNQLGHHSDIYTMENGDLIPGKEIINDEIIYNDNISYSWVTLRDAYGHIQTALIGFTIPYFVLDFFAEGVNPYYNLNPDGTINPDVSLIDRVDDGSHPFYENWKLHIPHGIKGDSIVDVELVNTTSQIDSVYYKDPELTIIVPDKTTNKYAPIINLDQIDFKTATSLPIDIDGTIYYIENDLPYHKNTTTAKLRYKKYNYDKNETGEYIYVDIAPYNVVRSMWVDPDGDLYADYTHTNIQNLGKIKLVKGTFGIVQIWANQSLLFDDNPDLEARVAIPPEYMNYARYKRDRSEPFIMDPEHPETGYDDRYIGWIAGVDPAEGSEDQYPSFYYYDYTATKEEDKWNFIGMLDGSMYDPETIFAIREANDDPKDILREKGVWALAEKRKAI